jgi:hypothetical protein
MTGEHEEVLAGGNMTAVVRVGDTVRRGADPWTTTIHAFMRRLRELVAFIERKAAAGDAAQQAVLARGDVIIYERDITHIEQLMER